MKFSVHWRPQLSHSGHRKRHRKTSHHHPQDLDISESGIIFIHLEVHMEVPYSCCYWVCSFTDGIHCLLPLEASCNEVIGTNQDVFIIPLYNRQSILSHRSKNWCVNCLTNPYISVRFAGVKTNIYHKLYEHRLTIQPHKLSTIQWPDNNNYFSFLYAKLFSSPKLDSLIRLDVEVCIL